MVVNESDLELTGPFTIYKIPSPHISFLLKKSSTDQWPALSSHES